MTDPTAPFDEQAVLRELERLQQGIQAARRERARTVDEFDAFVRGFRKPQAPAMPQPVAGPASAKAAAAPAAAQVKPAAPPVPPRPAGSMFPPRPPVAPVSQGPETLRPASPAPPASDVVPAAIAFQPSKTRRHDGRASVTRYAVLAGIAAVVLVAVVLFLLRGKGDEPAVPPAQPAGSAAAQPSAQASQPSATDGTAAPAAGATTGGADNRPLQVVLTTLRPVWMRVTVDGEKVVERQVPSGQQLRFGAERSVAIRAGDAGGVRLTINGRDAGLLGRDGQIASRTIVPPGAQPRN